MPVTLLPGLLGPGRAARWRRSVLRRVLAAACLAGAVLAALHVVRPPPPPTTSVLVATRDVPAGSVLVAGDVTSAPVPVAAQQPGALTAVDTVAGRRTAGALAAGEAVTRTRLVPRSVTEGLPAGRVALHVVLADPGAAGLLVPGGVVAVHPGPGGPVLARDAVVLSLDPAPPPTAFGAEPSAPTPGAVLSLTPEAADRVLVGHGGTDGLVTVTLLATPG
ncbi:SAF domain-containing protein [Arthrobacter sp. NEB 688]|uniref:SAF domain-containing protein n=1 Tax=Arthrobacter sp. NEB 688 TaxID=904039 RepID=UPI001563E96D|nr:SAF domain-containing protein [Arthrobacter sp. NEB 688]QKE82536.1 SAF domain-containing protein [Arthrobacter sp. NEB 688]